MRSQVTLVLISLVGAASFLYPFVLPGIRQAAEESTAQSQATPIVFAAVSVVCLIAMLVTVSGDATGAQRSRTVALLGVLVAIDAALRFVPSIAGASPIFLLIALVGYVFGPLMGFQMGALTLLLSAFLTGGVGPWLPFQMLTSGWMGMTAGWLPRPASVKRRVVVIGVFGVVWGFLFGAVMNLWSWPFAAPGVDTDASLYWRPGDGAVETLWRYARFYVATSLVFDVSRAIGNGVLIALLGAPVLKTLERYRSRFTWQPWTPFNPNTN